MCRYGLYFCTELFLILNSRHFYFINSVYKTSSANCNSIAVGFIFERVSRQNLSNWERCVVVTTSTVNIAKTADRTQNSIQEFFLQIYCLSFKRKIKSFGPILSMLWQFEVLLPHTNLIQVWGGQKIILAQISHNFFNCVDMDFIFALNCSLF